MKVLVYFDGLIQVFRCVDPSLKAISMASIIFNSFNVVKDRYDMAGSPLLSKEELDKKIEEMYK